MTGTANISALIAYLVLGLVTGWAILVIRDDIRIKKANRWRKVRAVYLAVFGIAFATALVFTNGLGFIAYILGCVSALAYAAVRK